MLFFFFFKSLISQIERRFLVQKHISPMVITPESFHDVLNKMHSTEHDPGICTLWLYNIKVKDTNYPGLIRSLKHNYGKLACESVVVLPRGTNPVFNSKLTFIAKLIWNVYLTNNFTQIFSPQNTTSLIYSNSKLLVAKIYPAPSDQLMKISTLIESFSNCDFCSKNIDKIKPHILSEN